eukprot:6200877-Pleurochrysis_carterae.AAC.2
MQAAWGRMRCLNARMRRSGSAKKAYMENDSFHVAAAAITHCKSVAIAKGNSPAKKYCKCEAGAGRTAWTSPWRNKRRACKRAQAACATCSVRG